MIYPITVFLFKRGQVGLQASRSVSVIRVSLPSNETGLGQTSGQSVTTSPWKPKQEWWGYNNKILLGNNTFFGVFRRVLQLCNFQYTAAMLLMDHVLRKSLFSWYCTKSPGKCDHALLTCSTASCVLRIRIVQTSNCCPAIRFHRVFMPLATSLPHINQITLLLTERTQLLFHVDGHHADAFKPRVMLYLDQIMTYLDILWSHCVGFQLQGQMFCL